MVTCHLEAHSRDRPSESARLAVRWYVLEVVNLSSAAMAMDPGQQLSPDGIETPDGFPRVANSRLICLGGCMEVGYRIVTYLGLADTFLIIFVHNE